MVAGLSGKKRKLSPSMEIVRADDKKTQTWR
jgi:hypothetical protein